MSTKKFEPEDVAPFFRLRDLRMGTAVQKVDPAPELLQQILKTLERIEEKLDGKQAEQA